jgi:hypothetical protein
LAPDLLGEGGERQQIHSGSIEMLGDFGELLSSCVEHSVILGDNRFGIGLVEDRV